MPLSGLPIVITWNAITIKAGNIYDQVIQHGHAIQETMQIFKSHDCLVSAALTEKVKHFAANCKRNMVIPLWCRMQIWRLLILIMGAMKTSGSITLSKCNYLMDARSEALKPIAYLRAGIAYYNLE
jgi:hypothetical protein